MNQIKDVQQLCLALRPLQTNINSYQHTPYIINWQLAQACLVTEKDMSNFRQGKTVSKTIQKKIQWRMNDLILSFQARQRNNLRN